MRRTAYIALGGNLGDVARTMHRSVESLRELSGVEVLNCSGLYATSPIGNLAGESFLNAVVCVRTSLEPEKLLSVCQGIENRLGRVRGVRWGPRHIDLDLIAVDDLQIQSETLSLPHPACWYRRFVLDPLTEIASDWRHPQRETTAAGLQSRLLVRPLSLDLSNWEVGLRDSTVDLLGSTFSALELETTTDINTETENGLAQPPTWKVLGNGLSHSVKNRSEKNSAASKNNAVSRLELSCSPEQAAETLIDIVRSALDEPQRIADFP